LTPGKRSARIDRIKALEKMSAGEPLSQYDVDLIQVMPTQKKALALHLEKQKNGTLEPVKPVEVPPAMTEAIPGKSVDTAGASMASPGMQSVDEALFQAWVSSLPKGVQAMITRQVDEPPHATFSHRTAQMLAANGSSDKDVATLLGVEKSKLQAEGKAALELGRTQYRFMLNQRQLMAAMAGDRTILQLLGKHKLGQNDKGGDGATGGSAEQADAIKRAKEKLSRVVAEARRKLGADV
jgi:hypothetical protein